MHESGEMYLETILILKGQMPQVRSIDVANQTGYSKPSVSRAIGLLKNGGYINVDDGGHITFTPSGESIAKRIYERHMQLSALFIKLGVSPEVASKDACKIEHDISDETFEALKKVSDNMK